MLKKSTRKGKKYMVLFDGKWIHFGSLTNQHYRDQTPLKLYSNLDHEDTERRKRFLARAKGIRDKNNKLTYKDPTHSNYWAIKYLW